MKKTLKRLQQEAIRVGFNFVEVLKRDEASEELLDSSIEALLYILRYTEALEDYNFELDESWDHILKSIEKTQQPKPTQKKEEAKKTSYIK